MLMLLVFIGFKTPTAFALDNSLDDTASIAGFNVAEKGEAGIVTIINYAVKGFLAAMALIFLGLMLYAGIRWLTARGQEELITKAQETLQTAIIGLIIILAAYAITSFILGLF